MVWRWDQGRLDYFSFGNLAAIAESLVQLNGVNLRQLPIDPIRKPLENNTGLPFAPLHYRVWRNYARVFGAAMLAVSLDGILTVTDVCRHMASNTNNRWQVDEYFTHIIPRFYQPSPVFSDYLPIGSVTYPYCVILRYLVARYLAYGAASIHLNDVFSVLIGNSCIGGEAEDYYLRLQPTGLSPTGDQRRQVREMLIFLSQATYLKYGADKLYLDLAPGQTAIAASIAAMASPLSAPRNEDPAAELLRLGMVQSGQATRTIPSTRDASADVEFAEGRKVRVNHLRTERSPQLRRIFLRSLSDPNVCDACQCDTKERYPWTDGLVEIHHLLPLSSIVAIGIGGTLLSDLRPVCPTCHKAVHLFYSDWLANHSLEDFPSKQAAEQAYEDAKTRIRP
ncbi:MAG: HNH endonuclease [Dehalococcoidia bacterium]|nr:HNH endonuclease [Dehalococcoidia bacterium]